MLTKLLTLLSLASYITRYDVFQGNLVTFIEQRLLSLVTSCNFQGEICVAFSRVFVQEGIYDEFEKKVVEKAKAWVVGDPFDPKVQQGPQVKIL